MKTTSLVRVVPFWLALAGCGTKPASVSSTEGLAQDGAGRNAAVVVGAPHNLAGVPTDIREFPRLLQDSRFNFRFPTVATNGDATAQEIIDLSAETARDADSLVWFFSGHGNTGVLLASDRTFTFHEVANAIKAARSDRPLKRLLVFIDSCYSGSFVDGREPIIENGQITAVTDALLAGCRAPSDRAFAPQLKSEPEIAAATEQWAEESLFGALASYERGLFEEAFVMASSTRYESSADLGAEKGGAFTWAMRQVMPDLRRARELATVEEFATATRTRTQREGGHTPVWRGFPADRMLRETMFVYE